MQLPPRLHLAQLPTPLEEYPRLRQAWGGPHIWIKRDDLTGFGLSGNKVRKLEFHLAAAEKNGADTVLTCGAVQSNHCRATALACARLGLKAILFLRSTDGKPPPASTGNHRISQLAGADIRYVTPEEYRDRAAVMGAEAAELVKAGKQPWVIPEGASDALGMWGMARAYQEMIDQFVIVGGDVGEVWHTASSGGTTAGFGWAADRALHTVPIVALSIGDQVDQMRARVEEIWTDALATTSGQVPRPTIEYIDKYIGGGYGVVSEHQLEVQAEATRATGLLFDPTYTGKAIFALHQEIQSGRFGEDDHVIFWHTGGGFEALSTEASY